MVGWSEVWWVGVRCGGLELRQLEIRALLLPSTVFEAPTGSQVLQRTCMFSLERIL